MKYWLDTEFIERGRKYPIDLISIGIVAEDGREFYRQNAECNLKVASDWVIENVVSHLVKCPSDVTERLGFHPDSACNAVCPWDSVYGISKELLYFCSPEKYGKPEFWAYYADYDWVVLCQLFGTMMDLPKGWPKYCRDLKQFCDDLGNPKLPEQGKGEHHALRDAQWVRRAWEFLDAHAQFTGAT